jgi:DNA-binding XRE family transcriptional regulator
MPGPWTTRARARARERGLELAKANVGPDSHPVRLARLALDLTQRDLADATGVSADTISGLELGRHRPHVATARVLAAALDMDPAAVR